MVGSVLSRAGDLDLALAGRHPDVADVRDFHEAYLTASGYAATGGRASPGQP